jgi:hypothetical protein
MPSARGCILWLAMLVLSPAVAAQQSPRDSDSARAQIQTKLRAFYFNLAHGNLEALTADILAAKVVAHRTPPELLTAAARPTIALERARATGSSSGAAPAKCAGEAASIIDQATITLEGDWAEVTVPRCGAGPALGDRFRLIRFEGRWRFVGIELCRFADSGHRCPAE